MITGLVPVLLPRQLPLGRTIYAIPELATALLTVASDIDVLARFGRALADPIRCRILLALRQGCD